MAAEIKRSKETELALAIENSIGTIKNIKSLANCMTRLRLTLHDPAQADLAALKKIAGVLGVVETAAQLQIILGVGVVNKVAAILSEHLKGEAKNPLTAGDKPAETDNSQQNTKPSKPQTQLNLFLRQLANIFVPLIPAIVGSGIVAGLTNLLVRMGANPADTVIQILNSLGLGIFSYLGIFVGMNAAKEFGGTIALGGLAGIIIINPAIAEINIGGEFLTPGRGGLIGVLLVAYLMCWLEKKLRKIVPNALDIVVTPALTLLVAGFAAYFILQRVGGYLSDGIIFFFQSILESGGVIAGYLLAGTFLPVVMTGLHQGLLPVHMELLNTFRANPLLPILAMAGAGQVGAAVAVYFKTKNKRLKGIIESSLPVGFLGIGEPLIFGVTLPLGRPFFTACLGAGFGGAWQAYFEVATIALGVSGLPLAFLVKEGSILNYLLGVFIAYLAGFLLTWLAGFDDPEN
ncbi:MAG: PTS transporter subunit EIIC [Sporomusaceae bacterium]|nr:PTS transporter subunit EIIC [Sporomusaceae bacterium]